MGKIKSKSIEKLAVLLTVVFILAGYFAAAFIKEKTGR